MLKRREKLMTKLLVLTMCISLAPTTVVFATGEPVSIVEGTQVDTVRVNSITLNTTNLNLTVGESQTLTVTVSPSDATNKGVTWSSSDNNVATIDANGKVIAIGAGSATITATANDGSGIKESKVITVSGQTTTLKSVHISGTEEVGYKLTAKVNYTGAEPSLKYKWQRANKKDGTYSNISGADGDEYKLKSSDNSKYIKLIVTATIDGQVYTEEYITSRIDSDDDDDDTSVKSSKNNSNKVIKPTIYNSSSPDEGIFTNPSGIPINGWINSNGNWYYLDQNGVALTGWINENGNWYYLSPRIGQNRATMQTGWIYDNGKWYFLNSVGIMVRNTTIDGYALGVDGAMI